MADSDPKLAPAEGVEATNDALAPAPDAHDDGIPPVVVPPRPGGWKYRGAKFLGMEWWYASPRAQLVMVSMVCFLCPGMFNALSGLGGAGLSDPDAANHANTALYCTFAVVGFFSGTFANRLGLRLTLGVGAMGYCVYVAAFLCYTHTANLGFVIFAGAFLGLCAGLLWTAQGAIMISYPQEKSKGRYISWFWMIFNLGAVIGSLIPLGQSINGGGGGGGSIGDGTYSAFVVLMFCGAVLALFHCSAEDVVRADGSRVIFMKNPSWKTEILGLWQTLAHDRWIVLLFPMFFSSNTFTTYQTQDFNLAHFNIRTRSLNDVLYWLSQILGSLLAGHALDAPGLGRALKARISFGALVVLTFAIWGGGWVWQRDRAPREVVAAADGSYGSERIDWTQGSRYIAPMFLFVFYGAFDAIWQTCIYWYIGALSNSGRKAANVSGFYKGLQSAGAGVWWRLDGTHRPYNTIFVATWAMLGAGLLFAAPVILFRIGDTTDIENDLKDTDETKADVLPEARLGEEKATV